LDDQIDQLVEIACQVVTEETFGPVLGIASYHDFDEALGQTNDTPYGLSAYLFTRNASRCHRAMYALETGSTWINDIHLSCLQCLYGGCKVNGAGRTQSDDLWDDTESAAAPPNRRQSQCHAPRDGAPHRRHPATLITDQQ